MSLFEKLAQRDRSRYQKKIEGTRSGFYPLKKTAKTLAKVGAVLYMANAIYQGNQLANSEAAQAYGQLVVHGTHMMDDLHDDVAFRGATRLYLNGKSQIDPEFGFHWNEANKAWETAKKEQSQLYSDIKSVYDPFYAIFH